MRAWGGRRFLPGPARLRACARVHAMRAVSRGRAAGARKAVRGALPVWPAAGWGQGEGAAEGRGHHYLAPARPSAAPARPLVAARC